MNDTNEERRSKDTSSNSHLDEQTSQVLTALRWDGKGRFTKKHENKLQELWGRFREHLAAIRVRARPADDTLEGRDRGDANKLLGLTTSPKWSPVPTSTADSRLTSMLDVNRTRAAVGLERARAGHRRFKMR